jgi:hypothetical protein
LGADRLPSHRRALEALRLCRTEAVGGHRLPCAHCGQAHDADPSCRHRRGPTCPQHDPEVWLAARRQARLPGPDLPVVLTRPHALHDLVRRHPQDLYDRWRRAAAQALSTRAMDPHAVGGLLGVLGIRPTWTRPLTYHPPVHGLVPAGGVAADRTDWRPARPSSRVPVHALAKRFRGRCRDLVRQDRPALLMPQVVWSQGWVVDGKPAGQGPEKVLNDLGRYRHRSALTHPRLLAIDHGQVGFRDQDAQDPRGNTMTWPAHECLRRFLPPVLPQGFPTVRDDGLWSPRHRPLRPQRQLCLAGHAAAPPSHRSCTHAAGNRGLGPTPPSGSTLSLLGSGPAGRQACQAPTPTGAP